MRTASSRLLLAALLAAPLAAVHGDPATPSSSAAATDRSAAASDKSAALLTLDFPGGTLADLLALMDKTGGAPTINVIGDKAALSTQVQGFTVQNADRDGVLRAIGQLLRGKGVTLEQVDRGMFIVRSDGQPKEPRWARGRTGAIFDSFPLAGIVDEQQSVDSIVDAIRAAWTLNPAHDVNALQIKYHPATKLLLISGPPEAVEITRQIVRSLHESRPNRKEPPAPR